MFTKEYLSCLQFMMASVYSGISSSFGFKKTYNVNGQEIYIGPSYQYSSANRASPIPFSLINSGAAGTSSGISFSNDANAFSGITSSVYKFPMVSGITASFVSVRYNVVSENKIQTIYRYNVVNNNSGSVTVRKFAVNASIPYISAYGESTSVSSATLLSFVQEFASPIVIDGGATAIIDVTVETELPE